MKESLRWGQIEQSRILPIKNPNCHPYMLGISDLLIAVCLESHSHVALVCPTAS